MNREHIQKLAHMARLAITEKEIDKYQDINEIMQLVDKIKAVDTTGVRRMSHPLDIVHRMREDEVTEFNRRGILQSVAPDNVEMGIYLVPKVFEDME